MADVKAFESEEPQPEVTSESVEQWFVTQVADKGAKAGGQLLGSRKGSRPSEHQRVCSNSALPEI